MQADSIAHGVQSSWTLPNIKLDLDDAKSHTHLSNIPPASLMNNFFKEALASGFTGK